MNLLITYPRMKMARLKNRCLILVFRMALFVLGRKLHLIEISLPDPIIVSDNHFSFFWNVKGCYKVIINNSIALPGNINSIVLDSIHVQDKVTIQFFGIGSVLKREFSINKIDVRLQRQFNVAYYGGNFLFKPDILLNSFCKLLPVRLLDSGSRFFPNVSTLRCLVGVSCSRITLPPVSELNSTDNF